MRFLILSGILAASALADAPKIQWQRGPCLGGNKPSAACKTCERCAYCGRKAPGREANSATCVVCEKARTAASSRTAAN